MIAQKSRKSLNAAATSYGVKDINKKSQFASKDQPRPPKHGSVKPIFKVGSTSLESERNGAGTRMHQSQTTKEDSLVGAVPDYSVEGRTDSMGVLDSVNNRTSSSKPSLGARDVRIKSGLGLRVKASLQTNQSKKEIPNGPSLFHPT